MEQWLQNLSIDKIAIITAVLTTVSALLVFTVKQLAVKVVSKLIQKIFKRDATDEENKVIDDYVNELAEKVIKKVVNQITGGQIDIDLTAITEEKIDQATAQLSGIIETKLTDKINKILALMQTQAEIYTNPIVKSATLEQKETIKTLLADKIQTEPKKVTTITIPKSIQKVNAQVKSVSKTNNFPKV